METLLHLNPKKKPMSILVISGCIVLCLRTLVGIKYVRNILSIITGAVKLYFFNFKRHYLIMQGIDECITEFHTHTHAYVLERLYSMNLTLC